MRRTLLFVLLLFFLSFSLFITLSHAEESPSSLIDFSSSNDNSGSNENTSSSESTTGSTKPKNNKVISVAKENMLIFAFLGVLSGAVLVIYIVVKTEFHYLPERYLNQFVLLLSIFCCCLLLLFLYNLFYV